MSTVENAVVSAVAATDDGKKAKSKRGRKAGRILLDFPIPDGGLTAPPVEFAEGVHKKLGVDDFADPIMFWRHEIALAENRISSANDKIAELERYGLTAKSRVAVSKLSDTSDNYFKGIEKLIADGSIERDAIKTILEERLAQLKASLG